MTATQIKQKRSGLDLTEGPILIKMIKFVLPLMATNFLQTFYNAADMMVVSLSSEANAVGAIGATGSLTNLLINIYTGFAAGTTILVARYLGARDYERVKKTVHTSVMMSIMFGLLTTLIGLFASRSLLTLMGADGDLLGLATTYTKIYFCGSPFLAATNYLSAIFRAKGDTKTPLKVLSLSGIINVCLNLIFVLVFDLSVEGVALATAIANVVSATRLIILLSKDDSPCRFSFNKCKLDGRSFAGIVREGLPAAIQSSLFSFSNIIIQSSIFKVNTAVVGAGSEYAPIVNGTSATANLDHFTNTAVNAVFQASITFSSQNYGAKKYKRIWRIMVTAILLSMAVAVIFSGFMIIFRNPLLSLYGIKNGVEGSMENLAYRAALTRMTYMSTTYLLLGFMNTSMGVMRGLGKTITSTILSLIGACGLRITWATMVFTLFPNADPFTQLALVYIAFPASWLITGLAQLGCSIFILKRRIRNAEA